MLNERDRYRRITMVLVKQIRFCVVARILTQLTPTIAMPSRKFKRPRNVGIRGFRDRFHTLASTYAVGIKSVVRALRMFRSLFGFVEHSLLYLAVRPRKVVPRHPSARHVALA